MYKDTLNRLMFAGALAFGIAGSSAAQAMDIGCHLREVGIHGAGTPDARVVARCKVPVSGVEYIAVPLSNPVLAERFLDVMTSAFLSDSPVGAFGGSQGFGCFGNCRITNQFVVWK